MVFIDYILGLLGWLLAWSLGAGKLFMLVVEFCFAFTLWVLLAGSILFVITVWFGMGLAVVCVCFRFDD